MGSNYGVFRRRLDRIENAMASAPRPSPVDELQDWQIWLRNLKHEPGVDPFEFCMNLDRKYGFFFDIKAAQEKRRMVQNG